MDRSRNNPPDTTSPESSEATGERRRLAQVVHDERGTARVEWHEPPPAHAIERPKLEVETFDDTVRRLAILNEGAGDPFNPYDRTAAPRRPAPPAPKRDLRKLSEWIKMIRGMQARGPEDEEEAND